jgi:5-methylcytosine-specific restriction endonuclease McrA
MNKQKTIHGNQKPKELPRGRSCKQCHCGMWFSLPTCHSKRHNSCSSACLETIRRSNKERSLIERKRECQICAKTFWVRPWQIQQGIGKFCSNACTLVYSRTTDAFKAARWAAAKTVKSRRDLGLLPPAKAQPKGKDSPYWKGGEEATKQRQKESGSQRKYRAVNPDKIREWSTRRLGKKTGRLPRGTVANLLEMQRNKCAICAKPLNGKYHVDHIMPLALNGKHERLNIQILCPTCNVRKNAKHPIRYAQELGKLL